MNTLDSKFHSAKLNEVIDLLRSDINGLSLNEVEKRIALYGQNVLPIQNPPTIYKIFFRQFLNPLIYVLCFAAAISTALGDHSDTAFIIFVLLINAIIGTLQEYNAEKSAQALRKMAASKCIVERGNEIFEIKAQELVLGDIVLLESGNKVPADLRLIYSHSLIVDESLLTGESIAIAKDHNILLEEEVPLADRKNMTFSGSLILKGRAKGIVTATGLQTELGKIAKSISLDTDAKPPLLIRMEKFTKMIALFLIFVTFIMITILLIKGESWKEVLMFSVALAVSAIPEGLPVALTVALAIASRRMSKRNVIVRKLPAVEALGSCSFIATDKTGTLTINQLTIKKLAFPRSVHMDVNGSGLDPKGKVFGADGLSKEEQEKLQHPLIVAGVLCNEAQLIHKNNHWKGHGDSVDLALLVLSYKVHINPNELRDQYNFVSEIPFEPENQFAATLHSLNDLFVLSIKGALEKILPMCTKMISSDGIVNIESDGLIKQADELAQSGHRVIALAKKEFSRMDSKIEDQLSDLLFLGMVGMIDPLRPEAANAIHSCHKAGVKVAMLTGDHPKTALAIAKEIGLASSLSEVVSGPQLKEASSDEEKANLIENTLVFARVEPHQKLEIVQFLLKNGHFVAVTGDGANDAPALKSANVGVAIGKSGTDIAKETSDLIITDDRFASIVAGIEEGRIAYNNVRKVVYLLISTGAAEILLFSLSLLFNIPLPLTAVQVLWLNLVTNGIQDVGLAFEPGEGDELTKSPRKPNEPIFDRLMVERIVLSAIVMGTFSFLYFYQIHKTVSLYAARNLTLLLMVLFENIMIGNCRSETKSAFMLNPFKNKILLIGTISAQLIHIVALYTPGIKDILGLAPISLLEWLNLFGIALSVLVVMEIYKRFRPSIGN